MRSIHCDSFMNHSFQKMGVSYPSANHCLISSWFYQPTTKKTPGFLHQRDQNLLKPAEVARRASVVALRCGKISWLGRAPCIPVFGNIRGTRPWRQPLSPWGTSRWIRNHYRNTPPKTNSQFAPENQWLEDVSFPVEIPAKPVAVNFHQLYP